MNSRFPAPHFSTPPRGPGPSPGPPTPQNYPTMAHLQHGPNGPQNVLVGPYNGVPGGTPVNFYPPYQQQGQPQSNCGTPSIASLQMV